MFPTYRPQRTEANQGRVVSIEYPATSMSMLNEWNWRIHIFKPNPITITNFNSKSVLVVVVVLVNVIGFGLKIWIRQFHSLSIDTFAAGYSMLTTLPRFCDYYFLSTVKLFRLSGQVYNKVFQSCLVGKFARYIVYV